METTKPIDLKQIAKSDALVKKLAGALRGTESIDWSKQFAASGKRPAPKIGA